MLAIVKSRAVFGIKAPLVVVEVHLSNGLPAMHMVGLPEAAVKESKDRVRSAIINSNYEFPAQRITINLAPADIPKEGGRFDLPIAIGILAASKQIVAPLLEQYEFAGELALNGELRPVRGALPIALAAYQARHDLIIAAANQIETRLIKNLIVYPAPSLIAVCQHLAGQQSLNLSSGADDHAEIITTYPDIAEVEGQAFAKRALEIAAAGGLSLLMMGPPGTGKSMLANRLPGIMPKLTDTEQLEVAAIQSIAYPSHMPDAKSFQRPFRAPHHSASSVAMVGGGSPPRPGEISLAHHGVLFLDELPEFDKRVLEAMREPLESGTIIISRVGRQAEFPAEFQLIAAMNPCPCGYHGDALRACRCTEDQVRRYQHRLSGPFLDRIDMHIEVPRLTNRWLLQPGTGAIQETSAKVRNRVEIARAFQLSRQGAINAKLAMQPLKDVTQLDADSQTILEKALQQFKLSARAYHRILKIARTIADLDNVANIEEVHIREALQYRVLDKLA